MGSKPTGKTLTSAFWALALLLAVAAAAAPCTAADVDLKHAVQRVPACLRFATSTRKRTCTKSSHVGVS